MFCRGVCTSFMFFQLKLQLNRGYIAKIFENLLKSIDKKRQ